MSKEHIAEEIYKGLTPLSKDSFPKKCCNCGKTFKSFYEFIIQTRAIRNSSGLRESIDDDGNPIVQLFRNCTCESTLLENFRERRDRSKEGETRRDRIAQEIKKGKDAQTARNELLNIMDDHKS